MLRLAAPVVFAELGWTVRRAHDFDPDSGHGFIDSQRMGLEVFKSIPPDAPLIVVEAVWQYSHHVLAGLRTHRGPILTVANFAGDWPGTRRQLTFAIAFAGSTVFAPSPV